MCLLRTNGPRGLRSTALTRITERVFCQVSIDCIALVCRIINNNTIIFDLGLTEVTAHLIAGPCVPYIVSLYLYAAWVHHVVCIYCNTTETVYYPIQTYLQSILRMTLLSLSTTILNSITSPKTSSSGYYTLLTKLLLYSILLLTLHMGSWVKLMILVSATKSMKVRCTPYLWGFYSFIHIDWVLLFLDERDKNKQALNNPPNLSLVPYCFHLRLS